MTEEKHRLARGCLASLVVNVLALAAVVYLLKSIHVANVWALIAATVVLWFLNTFIRPFIKLIALPVTILTLGLFTLVINALVFWAAAKLVPGFSVSGFWGAFWGALLLSVFNTLAQWFLHDD